MQRTIHDKYPIPTLANIGYVENLLANSLGAILFRNHMSSEASLSSKSIRGRWLATTSDRDVAAVVVLLFSLAFVHTAWVAEDAFITFRTIDNALHGLGLVWNPGERVQTYTHPLWLALLLPAVAVFKDPYYVSLALGYALSLYALLVLLWATGGARLPSALAIIALLWSRAFIDYSSSGLENPLTHALLATYLVIWLRPLPIRTKCYALTTLASAMFLSRPDAVVLIAPSLAAYFWQQRHSWRAYVPTLFLGALPALAWTAFSLIYYGAPVPNTALAKVQTGQPFSDNALQAVWYVWWTLRYDLPTIPLLVAGILVGLIDKRKRLFPLAVGLLAWFAYLFYVGADYMGGRFFSAPVLLAAALVALDADAIAGKRAARWLIVFLLATLPSLGFTIFSPPEFTSMVIDDMGVADERGFYYRDLGLIPALRRGTWFAHPWLLEGSKMRHATGTYARCSIGMVAYAAGPTVRWVDPLALADPFLSRLPSRAGVRVGHYERAFPPGYLDALLNNARPLEDPKLQSLYADVQLAVRGAVRDPERIAAVWRLNTGYHRNASVNYDPNQVGLPGMAPKTHARLSCFGLEEDRTWKLEGEPVKATVPLFTGAGHLSASAQPTR